MRLAALLLLGATTSVRAEAQEGSDSFERVWTCPVHREITATAEGTCELCQRELVPTLVRTAWSCPVHTVVAEAEPGACPVCGRTLYPVTEEVAFVCPMHAEVSALEPGTCPVCRMALEPSSARRPHQDHNPKHGGIFFMAPDAWHHLEGVYPEPGRFRVYLFDNFSKPMDARGFRGRAVLEESFDPDTGETLELESYPLRATPDGAYLEADVSPASLPRAVTAKIQFEHGGPLERFDFVFADLSRAEAAPGVAPASIATLEIPEDPSEIAIAIEARRARVEELVLAGSLGEIYVPALEAKDLAIALEAAAGTVSAEDVASLRWALKQLVRTAWLLDDYGDLGNRPMVEETFQLFDEAARTVTSVYGAAP